MRMLVRSLAPLSGLRIRRCHEPWCRSQMWLGSCVAVAVAMGHPKESVLGVNKKDTVFYLRLCRRAINGSHLAVGRLMGAMTRSWERKFISRPWE